MSRRTKKSVEGNEPHVANKELAKRVAHLYFLLEDLKRYENFQAEYEELNQRRVCAFLSLKVFRKTKKRRRAFLIANIECERLKEWYDNTDINKLKEELEDYEKMIDRKYWNPDDILTLEYYLFSDKAKSIEEAVGLLEKEKAALAERGSSLPR